MSFLSMFTGAKPEPSASSAPPATQPDPATQTPPAPQGMDAFSEMMSKLAPEPKPEDRFDASRLIEVNPEQLQQQVRGMNFMQGVATPELLAKVAEGGEAGVQAMLMMVNGAAQNAFAQSALATQKISSESLNRALPHVDKRVDNMFRDKEIDKSVFGSNPMFKHPAVKPMVQALIPQLKLQYPNASSEELAQAAGEYFMNFTKSLQPEAPKTPAQQDAEFDWSSWLSK